MPNNHNSRNGGISFTGLLQIAFIVLNDGRIEIAPYDKEAAQEGLYPFGYEDKEIDEIGNTLIDWIEISGVTHWMPLPEPPKEVQGDESL